MTFAFFRVRLDNGGGALSGPPPADGFVDPTPPTRYAGFADDARRDAKVRAHARWLRLEQLLASVGEVVGMRVVARSDNGPNAEEDFVEFVVTYEGSRGVYTTDETTGTLLEGELAVLRAVGRALGHDVDDLVVDPASPARRIVAATPVSGTVGERLAAVEGRVVVELKAGSVATAGAWTPAMLFRPGDLGGFWDFRPPYVFQDSAGTIPADIGDPVGFVRDLGPNGLHLAQGATSAKPSLLADRRGIVGLHFDAVDDVIEILSAGLTGGRELHVYAAVDFESRFSNARIVSLSAADLTYDVQQSGMACVVVDADATTLAVSINAKDSSDSPTSVILYRPWEPCVAYFRKTADGIRVETNRGYSAFSPSSMLPPDPINHIAIAQSAHHYEKFGGFIYAAVVYMHRVTPEQHRTTMTWMTQRAAVVP